MHINVSDLVHVLLGAISAYFTFRLNIKQNDRDYIVEQNKRLNSENKKLLRELDDLRKGLNKDETKH